MGVGPRLTSHEWFLLMAEVFGAKCLGFKKELSER